MDEETIWFNIYINGDHITNVYGETEAITYGKALVSEDRHIIVERGLFPHEFVFEHDPSDTL